MKQHALSCRLEECIHLSGECFPKQRKASSVFLPYAQCPPERLWRELDVVQGALVEAAIQTARFRPPPSHSACIAPSHTTDPSTTHPLPSCNPSTAHPTDPYSKHHEDRCCFHCPPGLDLRLHGPCSPHALPRRSSHGKCLFCLWCVHCMLPLSFLGALDQCRSRCTPPPCGTVAVSWRCWVVALWVSV